MMRIDSPPVFDEAVTWLKSGAARRYASAQLGRHGIRIPVEDVLADVTTLIWKRLRRGADTVDITNVPAYCCTTIKRQVLQLVRGEIGERRRRQIVEDQHRDDDAIAAPLVQSVDSAVGEALRSAVEATSGPIPTVTSAALTYLTLTEFPAIPVDDAPAPRAGANPDQARMWPALWFAGVRDGIFPDGEQHDAAQRQRLSRAARKVSDALERAAFECRENGPDR